MHERKEGAQLPEQAQEQSQRGFAGPLLVLQERIGNTDEPISALIM